MTTTAIFAELLVGGFQALGWMLFIVWLRTGYGTAALVQDAKDLDKWAAFIALVASGVAYGLGVLVDRMADSLFSVIDKQLRKRWYRAPAKVPIARLTVAQKSESIAKFLDYIRSRMRLARSTTFNALVIVSLAICASETNSAVRQHLGDFLFFGGAATILSAFVWIRISRTYYKRLAQAYSIVLSSDATGAAPDILTPSSKPSLMIQVAGSVVAAATVGGLLILAVTRVARRLTSK